MNIFTVAVNHRPILEVEHVCRSIVRQYERRQVGATSDETKLC